MLSPVEVPVSITRVCGHREQEVLRYRGSRERASLESNSRKLFCAECRCLVAGWLDLKEGHAYPLALPEVLGSVKAAPWATTIRAKVAAQMLPAMTAAVTHGGKTGAAVWQALYALMTQRQASFWIDGRNVGYSLHYVLSEAAFFAMGITHGTTFSERSIYGRWKQKSPFLIEDVKKRCPIAQTSSALC